MIYKNRRIKMKTSLVFHISLLILSALLIIACKASKTDKTFLRNNKVSIYKYKNKYVFAPAADYNGFIVSQSTFSVRDADMSTTEIQNEIERALSQIKFFNTTYKGKISEPFNEKIAQAVNVQNYSEFWANSNCINIAFLGDTIYLEPFSRATDFEGYEGTSLPSERFKNDGSDNFKLAERIPLIFKLIEDLE